MSAAAPPLDPLISGIYWTAVCARCGHTIGVRAAEPPEDTLALCTDCGHVAPYRLVVPPPLPAPDPDPAPRPLGLVLDRPLVVFDLETTGVDTKTCRIVEIAYLKIGREGGTSSWVRRVNPGIPIPPEATAIHGITDADVAGCTTFRELAPGIVKSLEGCDLCGFNIRSYDLKVLLAELARCGLTLELAGLRLVDALSIYHRREPRNLTAAVRLYCGRDHTEAHGALGDVQATLDVLAAQLARYEDLPRSVGELHTLFAPEGALDLEGRFRRDPDTGAVVFTFGKYSGQTLATVAMDKPDYLRWMLGQDFFDDTKALIRGAL